MCHTLNVNIREVLNGVGADGVGVKFPILYRKIAVVCSCPRRMRRKAKKNKKEAKKNDENEEKRRQTTKNEINGKIPPTPSTPTPLRTSQKISLV